MRRIRNFSFVACVFVLSCSHDIQGPSPEILHLEPDIVCNDQITTQITIRGTGMSPLGTDLLTSPGVALPEITLQKIQELDGTEAGSSEAVIIPDGSDGGEARVRWTSREEMNFDIYPELNFQDGIYSVTVKNRNGSSFILSPALVVVPPPSASSLEPDIVCTADQARQITVYGEGFLKIGDALPAVTSISADGTETVWGADSLGGCTIIPGPSEGIETCTELTFTIHEGELQPLPGDLYANYDIIVANPEPAVCVSTEPLNLTVVPPAELDAVLPDIICTEQFDNEIVLTGRGFLQIDSQVPAIHVGDMVYDAQSLDGCQAIEGPVESVQTCTSITFTIYQDDLAPGNFDVSVTNPASADCASRNPVVLTVVPPPEIALVDPPYICNEQSDSIITIKGSGFLIIDGENPRLTVNGNSFTAESLAGCAAVEGPVEDVQTCNELTFTIPAGTLTPGTYDISVTNPAPPSCGATVTASIVVVPPPEIQFIEPDIVCIEGGDEVFTVTGSGFIRDGDDYPTVSMDGTTFTADSVSGCTPIETAPDAETCSSLTFSVGEGELEPGLYSVSVTNPPLAACVTADSVQLLVAGPPVITSMEPPVTCMATPPSELTLIGENFLVINGTLPSVTFDAAPVTVTATGGCSEITGLTETIETCQSITFSVPSSLMTSGSHTISVINPPPADCLSPAEIVFEVALPPSITGVVPARVCATGIDITVTGDNFVPSTQVSLDGTDAATVTFVSSNEIQAHFDPMPGGTYSVTVSNGEGCEATLPDAVTVVELPYLFFVDPPVVYNGIGIQITIYASGIVGNVTRVTITPSGGGVPIDLDSTFDPARPNRIIATLPAGLDVGWWDVMVEDDVGCVATLTNAFEVTDSLTLALEGIEPPFGWTSEDTPVQITSPSTPPPGYVNFVATPRAYLNPHSPSPGDRAAPLRAVAFVDETLLTAVVSDGLPVDVYDLIVVNPDGSVGLLESAFEVVADPPPVIENITPASITNGGDAAVTAEGKNFRNPTADITCVAPDGTTTTLSATVDASTAESADITIPAGGLADGSACVLRLTNDDGTYVDYSAIAVTNPSENLWPFSASTSMNIARRGLSASAGRATSVGRFVYAIGGDDGTEAGAFDSVEAASVDLYGSMGAWRILSNPLPEPRTLAGVAQLGRYIYLVGGNNGGGETAQVLRAKILDSKHAPEITDIDLERGIGSGLDGGTWYYRVSAVMPATDSDNPDGETLPSDPQVVLLPAIPDKVHLTIYWIGVSGASGYRIYRSPTPDLMAGSERFLAEVGAGVLQYTDDGSVAPGTGEPLKIGDTGTWAVMASLNSPRQYPGTTIAKDPVDDTYYIYAVGGKSGGGVLANYEYASIAVAADGSQTMSSWTGVATNDLGSGRWQLNLLAMDHSKASYVPAGTTYIYAAGGANAGATAAIRDVDVAQVQAGGALGLWNVVRNITPARGGYGYAGANNTLYVFGGQGAQPSSTNASSKIVIGSPPDLENWNALGINLTVNRYLMGSAVESAFIFLVGGETAGGAPTNTTESTVW